MFKKLGLGLCCLIVRHRELEEPGIASFSIEANGPTGQLPDGREDVARSPGPG